MKEVRKLEREGRKLGSKEGKEEGRKEGLTKVWEGWDGFEMIEQSRTIAQTVHTKRSKKDNIFVGVDGRLSRYHIALYCFVLFCICCIYVSSNAKTMLDSDLTNTLN